MNWKLLIVFFLLCLLILFLYCERSGRLPEEFHYTDKEMGT